MNVGVFVGIFAGSLIAFVGILTVAFVVGKVTGWRNTLLGVGGTLALVAATVLGAGQGLAHLPERWFEQAASAVSRGE